MSELDAIHHLAINVADLDKATRWYQTSFRCALVRREKTVAVLQFENLCLTLVLPNTQPPHLAFMREDADALGELRLQPDGVRSCFVSDPTGNLIEVIKPS